MISRIRTLLNKEDISASKLAEKIGVQRSSISHILSERNKPSLEFIQKILVHFPHISAEWLLTGKGGYLKIDQAKLKESKPSTTSSSSSLKTEESNLAPPSNQSLFSEIKKGASKKTVRVITIYDDGSFDEFIK